MPNLLARAKFAVPVERPAVAADWAGRGYSCEPFTDPPGREWLDFVHDTDELVTVIEGRLEIVVGTEALIAEAGDEVFIPRRVTHSVKNLHAGTTRWLYGYN